jgi:hypothetical protein
MRELMAQEVSVDNPPLVRRKVARALDLGDESPA